MSCASVQWAAPSPSCAAEAPDGARPAAQLKYFLRPARKHSHLRSACVARLIGRNAAPLSGYPATQRQRIVCLMRLREPSHPRCAGARPICAQLLQAQGFGRKLHASIRWRPSAASRGKLFARSEACAEAAVPRITRPLIPWKIAAMRKKLNAR